ncbi:MAG: AAA family ATPase [Prevotellaceae bacterium]|nr:AAA family ATPase [Prevotellaceae bacterium]
MENVVRRIVIEKLYDLYDYDITFDKGGVTLITGPNGYGKTTILNIIKNALDLKFMYFKDLLFEKIEIHFLDKKDGTKLVITKVPVKETSIFTDEENLFNVKFNFYYYNSKRPKDTYTLIDSSDNSHFDFLNYLIMSEKGSRLEDDLWKYKDSGKTSAVLRQKFRNYSMFLNDIKSLFIREQRILSGKISDEDNPEKYTVTQLAEDLKARYVEQKNRYSDESQTIDSSFIKRLLNRKFKLYDQKEYYKRAEEINKIVESYKRFGLTSNFGNIDEYDEEFKPALSLYIEDMFDKISLYDDFFKKLALFNQFVNGKVLSNKTMILDERNGIRFICNSRREVPLHKLSSGEQNMIILFYRLVFETEPNTLLLIDEPENSLHVEWLQKMLSDYLVMESNLDCQMIIATHSPTFINGHWDIAYDLYGGSYQDFMES